MNDNRLELISAVAAWGQMSCQTQPPGDGSNDMSAHLSS